MGRVGRFSVVAAAAFSGRPQRILRRAVIKDAHAGGGGGRRRGACKCTLRHTCLVHLLRESSCSRCCERAFFACSLRARAWRSRSQPPLKKAQSDRTHAHACTHATNQTHTRQTRNTRERLSSSVRLDPRRCRSDPSPSPRCDLNVPSSPHSVSSTSMHHHHAHNMHTDLGTRIIPCTLCRVMSMSAVVVSTLCLTSPLSFLLPVACRVESGAICLLLPHMPGQAALFIGASIPLPLPWNEAPFRAYMTQPGLEQAWPTVSCTETRRKGLASASAQRQETWLLEPI